MLLSTLWENSMGHVGKHVPLLICWQPNPQHMLLQMSHKDSELQTQHNILQGGYATPFLVRATLSPLPPPRLGPQFIM